MGGRVSAAAHLAADVAILKEVFLDHGISHTTHGTVPETTSTNPKSLLISRYGAIIPPESWPSINYKAPGSCRAWGWGFGGSDGEESPTPVFVDLNQEGVFEEPGWSGEGRVRDHGLHLHVTHFTRPTGSTLGSSSSGSRLGSNIATGSGGLEDIEVEIVEEEEHYKAPHFAPNDKTLILTHGFGAGAAMMYDTVIGLMESENYKHVLCVDLPGFSQSSRPAFSGRTSEEAVAFFTGPLLHFLGSLRNTSGLRKFTLMGHSLGGFVCGSLLARAAPEIREAMEEVILLSPIGIPTKPHTLVPVREPSNFVKTFQFMVGTAKISPLSFVRNSGSWGHKMVGNYVDRRFRGLSEEMKVHFHTYMHNGIALASSGDTATFYALDESLYAHDPVGARLAELAENSTAGSPMPPVTIVHGENDWISRTGADRLARVTNGRVRSVVTPGGHHFYLDDRDGLLEVLSRRREAEIPTNPAIIRATMLQ